MKTTTQNVAAFEKLLGRCTSTSDSYKPGNPSITSTALTAVLEEAQKSIAAVQQAEDALTKAVNVRAKAFNALPNLGFRVLNAAAYNDLDSEHLKDLNRIRKRFRSQPFLKKGTALNMRSGEQAGRASSGTSDATPPTPARKHRILSYDAKLQTLADIIEFLSNEPTYRPNESDLTIAGLRATLASLHAQTAAVTAAKIALHNAFDYREAAIFSKTGIVGIATKVKQYFRSMPGNNGSAYKEVNRIKFLTS